MNVGPGNQDQIKLRRCNASGFLTIAQNNRVLLLLLVVITHCLMSAPDVSYPLKLTQLFHLNKNWVAALSLRNAAERLEVSSLKSSEKMESFSAGRNINRPERAKSVE